MIFPVAVGYSLESVATLYSLRESPYVHFKHIAYNFVKTCIFVFCIFCFDTLQLLTFICHTVLEIRSMDVVILV